MPITIGALRESAPGETRVSLVPEVVDKFMAAGARVVLEPGAGVRAQFPDALYKKGEWLGSSAAVLAQADVLLTVAPLSRRADRPAQTRRRGGRFPAGRTRAMPR